MVSSDTEIYEILKSIRCIKILIKLDVSKIGRLLIVNSKTLSHEKKTSRVFHQISPRLNSTAAQYLVHKLKWHSHYIQLFLTWQDVTSAPKQQLHIFMAHCQSHTRNKLAQTYEEQLSVLFSNIYHIYLFFQNPFK